MQQLWSFTHAEQANMNRVHSQSRKWCGRQPRASHAAPESSSVASQLHSTNGEPVATSRSHASRVTSPRPPSTVTRLVRAEASPRTPRRGTPARGSGQVAVGLFGHDANV